MYDRVLYLIVEGAVGRFLRQCVFFQISHTDKNCRVDVHADQLPSLQDVHVHLHTHKHTLTYAALRTLAWDKLW